VRKGQKAHFMYIKHEKNERGICFKIIISLDNNPVLLIILLLLLCVIVIHFCLFGSHFANKSLYTCTCVIEFVCVLCVEKRREKESTNNGDVVITKKVETRCAFILYYPTQIRFNRYYTITSWESYLVKLE